MHLASTRALAIALLSSLASAQAINFASAKHATGLEAHDTAAGDFDADGVLDVAAVGAGFARVAVLRGTGGGTLAPFQLVSGLGTGPVSVVAGDLTGDGIDDLAVACRDADAVSILHGVSGTLPVVASAHAVGDAPQWIVAADLDLDGDIDLATPCAAAVGAALLYGDGLGGFAPAVFHPTLGGSMRMLTSADCHADGDPDLIGAGASSSLSILHGNGAGGFSSTTSLSPYQKLWAAVGDLDGDMLPDCAAREWGSLDDSVSRLKGNAAGTFTYQGWDWPSMITGEFVDVTGDGLLDWVAFFKQTFPAEKLGVYPGTGTFFGFGPEQSFKLPTLPSITWAGPTTSATLATTDLDANGQLDVVASYGSTGGVYPYVSAFLQSPPAPPAISAVTPVALPLVGAFTLDVTGSGFTSLKSIKLGTLTIGSGPAFSSPPQVDGDGAFSLLVSYGGSGSGGWLPLPVGPTTLTVTNNFGSASFPVEIVAPDPPALACTNNFGSTATLFMFAAPGTLAYIAASPQELPSSIPGLVDLGIGSGFSSLVYLGTSVIPSTGSQTKAIGVAGVTSGTTIHFQFAALDPAAPAFPLKVSNVASGTKN